MKMLSGFTEQNTIRAVQGLSLIHILMKQAQVNIPLKAVVTPTSKSWVFGDLLAHLQEDVSYTHLDVYKRQGPPSHSSFTKCTVAPVTLQPRARAA